MDFGAVVDRNKQQQQEQPVDKISVLRIVSTYLRFQEFMKKGILREFVPNGGWLDTTGGCGEWVGQDGKLGVVRGWRMGVARGWRMGVARGWDEVIVRGVRYIGVTKAWLGRGFLFVVVTVCSKCLCVREMVAV